MTVRQLIQELEKLPPASATVEVVAHYPEFDYPFSLEKVEMQTFRDPDQFATTVLSLKLGDN